MRISTARSDQVHAGKAGSQHDHIYFDASNLPVNIRPRRPLAQPQPRRQKAQRRGRLLPATEGLSAIILIGNVESKKTLVLEPCFD
jgi:hypothetical protein